MRGVERGVAWCWVHDRECMREACFTMCYAHGPLLCDSLERACQIHANCSLVQSNFAAACTYPANDITGKKQAAAGRDSPGQAEKQSLGCEHGVIIRSFHHQGERSRRPCGTMHV